MFGLFKKKFTVDDLISEIKKIHNSVENNDECHTKVYTYCDELRTSNLDIIFHKRLFQSLSFMESPKLRNELTEFDRQRNFLIIQGVCMDVADRMKLYPSQLSVTFHNYCEFLVKNDKIQEIHSVLSYILSGLHQRFNSAINNHWPLEELIIRNRIFMEFYSIILANLSDKGNSYGLGMDGIYNNIANNCLDTFYNYNIFYSFIPTNYYDEDYLGTIVWNETLDNCMTINIILDKPIPREFIIINPDNGKEFFCYVPALLTEPDVSSDTPTFRGKIINLPHEEKR